MRGRKNGGTIPAVTDPHGLDVHARLRDEGSEDHHDRLSSKHRHHGINDQKAATQPVLNDRREKSRENLHRTGLATRRSIARRTKQLAVNVGDRNITRSRDRTVVKTPPHVVPSVYDPATYCGDR